MIARALQALGVIFALLLAVFLVGCTEHGELYNLTTAEVVPVKFSYSGSGKGKVSGVFASGEQFSGRYATIPDGETSWGSIYASAGGQSGSAITTSGRSSNQQRGAAVASGNKGTVIQCEYVVSVWSVTGTGVCKDNYGTLYRLMF
jgi:hypothetical protein